MSETIAILGAGHAGGRAAAALRHEGFAGRIVLVGAEPHLPYERPPLSKAVLTGDAEPGASALAPRSFYESQHIDLALGAPAVALDAHARTMALANGRRIAFDQLLICTGGVCRTLAVEGAGLAGIHTLRTIEDAQAIRAALGPSRRLVVIGGGFIGLEVAASAISHGARVTVVEAAPRIMGRAVPPALAGIVAGIHEAAGVTLLTGRRPERFTGAERVAGVVLEDGEEIAADAVVVGIGIRPAVELAEAAGLGVDNGILVDEHCRASAPGIFAAGDVANAYHPLFARHIRLESWRNAQEQPVAAARAMLGRGAPYAEIPWLWSDQYAYTLQTAGLADKATEVVTRGALEEGGVIFFLLHEGVIRGACGIGRGGAVGRDIRVAQMLIARRKPVDAAMLRDPATRLKTLLRAG